MRRRVAAAVLAFVGALILPGASTTLNLGARLAALLSDPQVHSCGGG